MEILGREGIPNIPEKAILQLSKTSLTRQIHVHFIHLTFMIHCYLFQISSSDARTITSCFTLCEKGTIWVQCPGNNSVLAKCWHIYLFSIIWGGSWRLEVKFEFITWGSSDAIAKLRSGSGWPKKATAYYHFSSSFFPVADLHIINKQWKTGLATARIKISGGYQRNSGGELKLYLRCFRNTIWG